MDFALRFEAVREDDLVHLTEWHADAELAARYGGTDWPAKLWEILNTDPSRRCFIAWNDDEAVGYLDWELHPDENLAWIGLAVKPELRAKGWGTRILRAWLESEIAHSVGEIRAGIEPDNPASVRCFSSAGFKPMSDVPDEEGIIDYSYTQKNGSHS